MQCPTCGATLPDDSRFCGACGTDLATPSAGEPVFPPEPRGPVPGPPAPGRKRNTGLIIGIVAGALVLLLMCCVVAAIAIPAFTAYRAARAVSATQPDAESSAAKPDATNPEPPASEMSPQPTAAVLSEESAKQLVLDYLGKAKAGQTAEAKAVVTPTYTSRITSDYYDLIAKDLQQFEVVKAEQADSGYRVFVKETWGAGVWTNWYLVVLKNGKLVIDDYGTE